MPINLGFGGSKTSQNQTSVTTQNEQQIGSQSQQGSGITTTLDPQTIQTLQGIIQTLAPGVGQSPDAEMIRTLSSQLATSLDPALVNANIKASQDVAIRNFQNNQGAQIAGLQQQVGSKGNAFSQIIQSQGNADLAALLAQISTQGQLGFAAQRAANLGGAMQGFGAASQVAQGPMNQLLAAIATLTGARTEQTTQQNSLSNLISSLTSRTDTTGTTKSRGFSLGFGGGG